jgi:hypothetical protein
MKKVQYNENKGKIQNLEMNINHTHKLIINSVKAWNKICPEPITLNELRSFLTNEPYRLPIIENVEALLKDKLILNKKVDFDGLQVNVESLKNLLILPNLTNFIATLQKFSVEIPTVSFSMSNEPIYWQHFYIVKGKVTVLSDTVEIQKESYKLYATTQEELKRLNTVKPLCEALTNFMKSNPEINPDELFNKNLIDFYYDKFIPNYRFIETGRI